MPATELIAVSIPANHPSGTRRRAGFEFTTTPSVAEVTADEKLTIKSDPYLTVHRRLSLAWFKAFNIEHTDKAVKKYAEKDPEDWKETALLARRPDAKPSDSQGKEAPATGGKESQQDDSDTGNKKSDEVKITSSKEDIVKALEGLGLSAGKDFDPDANRNALFAIYREKAAGKAS